jgi:DNA polymerase III delta subunit
MLYVLVGDNQDKKKEALAKLLATHPESELFYMNEESFSPEVFANFLGGGDLFSLKYVVVLDSLVDTETGELIVERARDMQDSDNIFIVKEVAILKDASVSLKKAAEMFETYDLPKIEKSKFNIFSITDAFGARDKKNTWVMLQKALRAGVSAEEVLNILIWQTKNLLFVKRSTDMKNTGLSPFVYNKSKQYSANYKESELVSMSRSLTKFFHESHLGLELGPNLESYLLKTL